MSIIAKQAGHRLGAYETDSGYSLELLYPGKMSAKVTDPVLPFRKKMTQKSYTCQTVELQAGAVEINYRSYTIGLYIIVY